MQLPALPKAPAIKFIDRPIGGPPEIPPYGCPEYVRNDLSLWPVPLRRFIEPRGADTVWLVGLAVLGYPPSWCGTAKEIAKVVEALDKFEHDKQQRKEKLS